MFFNKYEFSDRFKERFNEQGLNLFEDSDFTDILIFLTEADCELSRMTSEIQRLSSEKEKLTNMCIIMSNHFTPELFREKRKEVEDDPHE